MKHRLITLITIIALLAIFSVPSFASSTNESTTREVIYNADGSYDVIETKIEISPFATDTKTASRTFTHSENNVKQWTFTLRATFTYNGSTAKATASSCSYEIFNTAWKCVTKDSWTTGATAKASATFKRTASKEVTIGMKCSPSGEITPV